jgi:hypothetical protein
MDPVQPSNFDIVMHDSLTPSADSAYNLGQDLTRFLFGYFQRVRLSGNDPHYDDEAVTYEFLGPTSRKTHRGRRRRGWIFLDAHLGPITLA